MGANPTRVAFLAKSAGSKAVGDLEIEEWINENYGFVPHPYWIAHCKELYLGVPAAEDRPPSHQCPLDKRAAIRNAFFRFGMLLNPGPTDTP